MKKSTRSNVSHLVAAAVALSAVARELAAAGGASEDVLTETPAQGGEKQPEVGSVTSTTGEKAPETVQTATGKPADAPKEPKAPSKAEISRGIMKQFHADGKDYEAIIAEMMRVNGYDRQLARGTYKANFTKAGVPAPVEGKRPTKKADAPAADANAAAPAATA